MKKSLMNGVLEFPGSYVLETYPDQEQDILAFWKAIWNNYLCGDDTNGLFWYERLGFKVYNDVVRRLCHNKWIISNSLPGRKWASVELREDKLLEIVTPDELQDIKAEYMYQKYILGADASTEAKLVRQNGTTKRTGLVRRGFRNAGNTQFGYDTEALRRHEKAVKLNLTKSMDKVRESYPEMRSASNSYDQVSTGIFDWHCAHEMEIFTTGTSISDSRGRAISNALTKVMNPISSKDARAALVITY